MHRALLLFLAATALLASIARAPAARADGASAKVEHLEVEVVSEFSSIRPGSRSTLGLRFRLDPHWHIYWKNAGDSGLPPTVRWTLPAGAVAGPIQWPTPVRLFVNSLAAFAYEGEFVLPVRVSWPATLPVGPVEIRASVDWLVCQEECTPGEANLALTVPVADAEGEPDPRHEALFLAARALLPRPILVGAVTADRTAEGLALTLPKGGPWDDPAATLDFFPEADILANAVAQTVVRGPEGTTLHLARSKRPQPEPKSIRGVVVVGTGSSRVAFAVDTASVAVEAVGEDATILGAVLLALLGGVLLNLMPCVLPVLSLKVLGFVERAGEDPRRARRHGWAYGVGVIAAFWVLAGIVLAIRAGGERVGWGFQLQEPLVVAGTVMLFHVMGLNLFGVFEFGTGLASLASRGGASGYAGSFWGGALATVVATPCTGPFMGAALATALQGSAATTLAVLTALGVGMAAPYVLLATFPRALAKVPRPGPWMDSLKRGLAFPLFAAAIWFAGVFGSETGASGLLGLLWVGLLVTVAAWIFGRWGTAARGPRVRWIAGRALPLVMLAASVLLVLRAAAPASADADRWEPYSAERVAEGLAEGRPVFVDFTADWCISCKANEAAALSGDAFWDAVQRHDVVALKADWTKKDARIRAALRALHRDSVPVYVVYSPVPGRAPVMLPQVLTPGIVIDALAAAAAAPAKP